MLGNSIASLLIAQGIAYILGAEEGLTLFITHGADSTLRVYDAAIRVIPAIRVRLIPT